MTGSGAINCRSQATSLDSRAHAYLCSGAEEVIVVGADGTVEFRFPLLVIK